MTRVALLGGIYSNYLALEAAIADAQRRGAGAMYCLGDLGAFGPHPDRAIELLRELPASAATTTIRSAASWPTASAATPIRGTTILLKSVMTTRSPTPLRTIAPGSALCLARFASILAIPASCSVTAARGE
jgi:hypothetical protein